MFVTLTFATIGGILGFTRCAPGYKGEDIRDLQTKFYDSLLLATIGTVIGGTLEFIFL